MQLLQKIQTLTDAPEGKKQKHIICEISYSGQY